MWEFYQNPYRKCLWDCIFISSFRLSALTMSNVKLLCLVCIRDSLSKALCHAVRKPPFCWGTCSWEGNDFISWLKCVSVLPDFPYTSQALRGKQIDKSQFSQHTAGTLTIHNFPASLWKWYQKRIRLFFHKISIFFLVFCLYIWCTG